MIHIAESRINILRSRIDMIAERARAPAPDPALVGAWHESGGNVAEWLARVGDPTDDWIFAGLAMETAQRARFVAAIVEHLLSRALPDPWRAELDRIAASGEVRVEDLDKPPQPDGVEGVWRVYRWWQQRALEWVEDGVVLSDPYRDDLGLVCCAVIAGDTATIMRMLLESERMPWLAKAVPWTVRRWKPGLIADMLANEATLAIGLDQLAMLELDRAWTDEGDDIAAQLQQALWDDALLVCEQLARSNRSNLVPPIAAAMWTAWRSAERHAAAAREWQRRALASAQMRLQRLCTAIEGWDGGRWLRRHLAELDDALHRLMPTPSDATGLPIVATRSSLWVVSNATRLAEHRVVADLAAGRIASSQRHVMKTVVETNPSAGPTLWLPDYEFVPEGPWARVALQLDSAGKLDTFLRPLEFSDEVNLLRLEEERPDRYPPRHCRNDREFYTARQQLARKIRMHVRLMLAVHFDLARLPGLVPRVAEIASSVRKLLVEFLSRHCRDVPADGRIDIFAPDLEWSNLAHRTTGLLGEVGRFAAGLDAEELCSLVRAFGLGATDPVVLTELALTLPSAELRDALFRRVSELRPSRLAETTYWTPHVQRQVAALARAGMTDAALTLLNTVEEFVQAGYRRVWDPWSARMRMALLASACKTSELRAFAIPMENCDGVARAELGQLKRYFVATSRPEAEAADALREMHDLESLSTSRPDYVRNRLVIALRAAKGYDDTEHRLAILGPELVWLDERPNQESEHWAAEELACSALIEDWPRYERVLSRTPRETILQQPMLQLACEVLVSRSRPHEAQLLIEDARRLHGRGFDEQSLEPTIERITASLVVESPLRFDEDLSSPLVLVLGADPHHDPRAPNASRHNERLSLDEEAAAIIDALVPHARCVCRPDVSCEEVADLLERHVPDVVHMGSHGRDGLLLWEDGSGVADVLTADDLVELLERSSARLVVLAACETADVASAVATRTGRCVIGFVGEVLAPDLLAFAVELYGALRDGADVRTSYERAASATPNASGRLATGESIDANSVYLRA